MSLGPACDQVDYVRDATSFSLERDGYQLIATLEGETLSQAYRLRRDVFCHELGWVGDPQQKTESDRFDSGVFHLGVRTQDALAAYLRIHPFWSQWMIDSVFLQVVPPGAILHLPGMCEVSRLAVAQEHRRCRFADGRTAASLLYQLLFAFCRLNGFQTIYMVVTERTLRSLRFQGLPCRTWSTPQNAEVHRDFPKFATLHWPEFVESEHPAISNRRLQYFETEREARLQIQDGTGPSSQAM